MGQFRFQLIGLCLATSVAISAGPAYAGQSGAYIGGSVGYGWTDAKAHTSTVFSPTGYFATTSVPAINAAGNQSVKPNGVDAGIDVGYDAHAGQFLFGIAADVSILHGSDSTSVTATYPCCAPTAFTVRQSVKTKWMTTLRGRVGLDVGPGAVYVTGGYAGLKARYSSLFVDTFATAHEDGSSSKYRSGWVVGAGADVKLGGGQWSVQPEFLHADFGHISATGGTLTAFTPPISFPTNTFTHRASLKTDVVRVGLHYHF